MDAADPFTYLFLILLAGGTLLRLWLGARQIRHVRAHRGQIPEAFAGAVSEDEHRKAADYTCARVRHARLGMLLDVVLLLAWTLGGGFQFMDEIWRTAGLTEILHGTAVILSVGAVSALAHLPLDAWSVFVIEEHFGFNRTDLRLWLVDLVRSSLVAAVLGGLLVSAILYVMAASGGAWWWWAWLVWAAFSITLVVVYPRFIAPLFNRFRPLDDPELSRRLSALLERCGFHAEDVKVMDASRRSSHGNAYFTGFGRNKRVVLFDTLLEQLGPDEIEAVLAHELGHSRLQHVTRRILLSLALGLGGLALLAWLAGQVWFYQALGVAEPSHHAALLLFILIAPVFTLPLTPLGAWWSRRHEFQADRFAMEHADAGALARALVTLYRDNASTLTPDPVHSAFYDSHPPPAVRIERLHGAAV